MGSVTCLKGSIFEDVRPFWWTTTKSKSEKFFSLNKLMFFKFYGRFTYIDFTGIARLLTFFGFGFFIGDVCWTISLSMSNLKDCCPFQIFAPS
jgi:hypothetical protein